MNAHLLKQVKTWSFKKYSHVEHSIFMMDNTSDKYLQEIDTNVIMLIRLASSKDIVELELFQVTTNAIMF